MLLYKYGRVSAPVYFEASASIIVFVLLGRYLEEQAKGKAGEAIRKLVDLQPQTATLLKNGREKSIDSITGEALKVLSRMGIDTLMVTGDNRVTAEYIASLVGMETIVANASPEQKLTTIRHLQEQGGKVGMIGDGINDAPALAAADVGFAIGHGTDIAIESADLTLVNGDIAKVAETIQLSTETLRVIKQNLFWAFAYNTVAIPVAAMGRLNPMIASAAMALSSVSVILNSLRLYKK